MEFKKIILFALFFAICTLVHSQAPQKLSYQALIRDSNGTLILNQLIGIEVSIRKGTQAGPVVYVEAHSSQTNLNGLLSLELGTGNTSLGVFNAIDWSDGPYFVETKTDLQGGTNYNLIGITELLSVPYALYANVAGSNLPGPQGPQGIQGDSGISIIQVWIQGDSLFTALSNNQTLNNGHVRGDAGMPGADGNSVTNVYTQNDSLFSVLSNSQTINAGFIGNSQQSCNFCGFEHYVGEVYGGGVIFELWKDNTGVEHGLIVSLNDLSTSHIWSDVSNVLIGSSAQSSWNGAQNTQAIITQTGHTNSAALLCTNYSGGGFNDWYLPSLQQLYKLWHNLFIVNTVLSPLSGATEISNEYYWSSTEALTSTAYGLNFRSGFANSTASKSTPNPVSVRAVRAF
jgi:hypothetical protein